MADNALPKGYEPGDVEARWGAYWEKEGSFVADPEAGGEPYSIVIPPPNVTGQLHMGHALNITLQDILCRHRRQKGDKVLWVPGTDHAGIATQNVVERSLAAQGTSRHELGREAFIDKVWEWREDYGGRILNQIRALGASVDWSRQRFTLDEGLSRAVREVFVTLYEEGLVYRSNYIINWCTRCHTALADDEVEHAPRQGRLHEIAYPLKDGSGHLVVATTRPETMLGDTAVAVNPEDERYAHLIGKTVVLPLLEREIPVIGDAYVDKDFGTGCLKVTPAHDMNDWELGRKHGLEALQVIDEDGNMTEAAGEKYAGMHKIECRKQVLADLEALGLLKKVEDYDHSVGHCYRCKEVIEPHVSQQWFVAVKPLAQAARKAVERGETAIYPDNWTKVYYDWLDNIRDWCVSRQIWWGHRIPAWTCQACGEMMGLREDPTRCAACASADLLQDEDVLDTWFSSALWPFSTLGWPDTTRELEVFYPTSVLVTGFDILFFWVARMMMMGIHFKEEVPFRDVYIHALVRDAEGKKMSKSTGNVIDPLDMISRYGCDSLRFTLTAFAAMGRDIKLSEDRIEGYRHFVNKLWNAARFTLMNLEGEPEETFMQEFVLPDGLHHAWIFHRLEEMKETVGQAIDDYRFNDAAMGLYQFIWHEFCDWYLETVKPDLNSGDADRRSDARRCLWTALRDVLTLLHPVMPFVTQEIWSHLPAQDNGNLALQPYPAPRPELKNPAAVATMEYLQQAVVSVRNIRAELNIGPAVKLHLIVKTGSEAERLAIEENLEMLTTLARLETAQAGPDVAAPPASASAVVGGSELFVPLAGAIDFDAELARLDKEIGKLDKEMAIVDKKLSNEGFVSKAPAEVVQKERDKAAAAAEKRDKLVQLQDRLRAARG